jgi:hypothetical protein
MALPVIMLKRYTRAEHVVFSGVLRAPAWLKAAAFAQPLSCNMADFISLVRAEVMLELEQKWVREELLRLTT